MENKIIRRHRHTIQMFLFIHRTSLESFAGPKKIHSSREFENKEGNEENMRKKMYDYNVEHQER